MDKSRQKEIKNSLLNIHNKCLTDKVLCEKMKAICVELNEFELAAIYHSSLKREILK
jgi:hypothetical protein